MVGAHEEDTVHLRTQVPTKQRERQRRSPAGTTRYDGILRLQRDAGNRATVQRLREYPTVEDASGRSTDLTAAPRQIVIAGLTYRQAEHYRDVASQQALDPAAHTNIVFDPGDPAAIDLRIAQLEPHEAQVLCMEGQGKVARPAQTLSFGDVTTCMTVTAIMADGTKVTAHQGMFASVPGGPIAKIQALIASAAVPNKTISRVLAAGVGYLWTTTLLVNQGGTWTVEQRPWAFENWLGQQLGCATVAFENHDGGELRLDAQGRRT